MKRILLLALLISSTIGIKAGEEGDLYFAAQGIYTTVDKYFGFGLRAEYNFWKSLEFSASFNYSPSRTEMLQVPIEIREYELNGNFHYLFRLGEFATLYPLVGINYTDLNADYDKNNPAVATLEEDKKIGANFGIGLKFDCTRFFRLGGEWKFVAAGGDPFNRHQFMIHAGYYFNTK